jgi:methylthioribose-1-phosphate isomerase
VPIAPEGMRVANPAFDVTPHRYVSAIITERGVARAPFDQSLRRLAVDIL